MTMRISLQDRLLTFRPAIRPMIAMKNGAQRGIAVDTVVEHAHGDHSAQPWLRRISDYDVERVDLAAIDEGLSHLDKAAAPGGLVMMPVAFSTLSSPRGRRDVLGRAFDARQRLKTLVLLEITALDATVPQSRLAQMVGLVRPACKAVFTRLEPTRKGLAAAENSGLDGVTIEAAYLRDAEDPDGMAGMVALLRTVGPRVVFHSLRTIAAIEAARSAGATYASLDLAHLAKRAAASEAA